MALRSNFISDIAKMANGASMALSGLREEIDNMIRQGMERALNARGLVTREEFDALSTRHETMAARVAVLEASMAAGESLRPKKIETPGQKGSKKSATAKKISPSRKKSAS